MISFSLFGAITLLNASIGFLLKRRTSTKFWITSISFSILNILLVSSRRLYDTAVMASLWLMENETTGANVLSLPTRVISVPWSVVITGIFLPCVSRIFFVM